MFVISKAGNTAYLKELGLVFTDLSRLRPILSRLSRVLSYVKIPAWNNSTAEARGNRQMARLVLILSILSIGSSIFPGIAQAAGWEWSSLPGRERVVVQLDAPDRWSVSRVGTTTLMLRLEGNNTDLQPGQNGGNDAIFRTMQTAPEGLYLLTNTNEFGYMVSRDGDNRVRIDLFNDPIGARWQPPAGAPENPVGLNMPGQADSPAGLDNGRENSVNAAPQAPRTQIDAIIQAQQQMSQPAMPEPGLPARQASADTPLAPPAEQVPAGSFTEANIAGSLQQVNRPGQASAPNGPTQQPGGYAQAGQEAAPGNPTGSRAVQPADEQGARGQAGIQVQTPLSVEQSPVQQRQALNQPSTAGATPQAANGQSSVQQQVVRPVQSGSAQNSQPIRQRPRHTQAEEGDGYLVAPISPVDPFAGQDQGENVPARGETPGVPPAAGSPNFQEGKLIPLEENKDLVMRLPGPVEPDAQEPPVQYDEDGNPIEPPPSVAELIAEAQTSISAEHYEDALDLLSEAKLRPEITTQELEDVLYLISDATFGLGIDDIAAYGDKILGVSEEALNANLKSARAPSMLLRLGYVNLKMGNIQEAEAYFNLLKRNHPNDENIPLIYYYWGDYFFEKENYQQAADQFQYIVQNYPDSKFVREASVGLARSLYKLGYFDQAFQIVDYIERRWPRFYMEYPPILEMIGDAALNMGKLEDARNRYWLYYNLDPSGPDAPDMLTRIGDIYLQEKSTAAAREVYEEAVRRFPNHDAGLIAQMRLAEEGIYDAPSIGDMFSVFDRPYSELPYETYSRIVREHPDSKLAPLAQLKLAIWYLWNKRYTEALTEATTFAEKYPEHTLLPKAHEVALAAFSSLTADSVTDKEYDRILHAWDQFPIIQGQEEVIGGESRLALAYSEWSNQRSADALKTLEPFFRGTKDFSYGEPALNLALTILVDSGQWQAVADLYRKVEMWELTPDTQRQLDYSMALAAENLRNYDQATVLWDSLRNQTNMPPEQKVYMFYFLAKAAERNKDMEQAYYLGRDALQGLTGMAEENPDSADIPKIKDLLAMLMNITEGAGRITEALDWQQQYAKYVSEDSPDYLAMRYRLGQLYRQNGDRARWALVMQELVERDPNSLYGRMAASELRGSQLSNDINSFLPQGASM